MTFSNKYHQLFYSSPDPIFIESLDGIILDANEAALKMHGLAHEELVGKNFIEFIPEDQKGGIKSNVENFIEDQIRIFESIKSMPQKRRLPIFSLPTGTGFL